MNKTLLALASILLGAGGLFLAYNNIEGWGWFLAGAIYTTYLQIEE